MSENIEIKVLNRLVQIIEDAKQGLDPEVLASWFQVIESEAKALAPEELRDKIKISQDPYLWMKFNLTLSKRAIPYIMEAIEKHLKDMPFATRLYFQKVEEIIEEELLKSYK
ncbi:MAG: hypothetical protein QXX95_02150 [Nitrososphaerales archaeon]